MKSVKSILLLCIGIAAICASGFAQTVNSGSTGADGDFNPTFHQVPAGTVINGTCGPGSSCTVIMPLREPPNHIYNFASFFLGQGTVLQFTRNLANTPVILLVQGDVEIEGFIDINGGRGDPSGNGGVGGPGGYSGGNGVVPGAPTTFGGAGSGPGGGSAGVDGTFATGPLPNLIYGNPQLQPLIGGSGGGALGSPVFGGSGGGGALLIASSGTLDLRGGSVIVANGGFILTSSGQASSGSGGAIRLVATRITGSGVLNALGNFGGTNVGRIRLESAQPMQFTGISNPAASVYSSIFEPPITVFPPITPTLRIVSIGNHSLPANPTANVLTSDITFPPSPSPTITATIGLEALHVPSGTTAEVFTSPQFGSGDRVISGPVTLTGAVGQPKTGSVTMTIPAAGVGTISAVIRGSVIPEP